MTRKIKVAQLVLSFDIGGLERLVANYLSAIDRNAFDITVGCLERRGTLAGEVEKLGIPVTTFDKRDGVELGVIPRIGRWLGNERVDVMHTHNAAAHFYGAAGAKFARIRTTIHTKHGRDWPDNPRKVLLNRLSALMTTKLVTVSQNGYEVARTIEKVPARKLAVIHNGVDTTRYAPARGARRHPALAGIPPGAPVVATVARLSPEKDQRTLLEAFAILCERHEDCFLVLAGDGPSRNELEAFARGLPCAERILFLGTIDTVAELLGGVSVFALTSVTEGISLALLEAGASGVPAVVTDAGGNTEVVVDGETGYVVAPQRPREIAEKIHALLSDPSLRGEIGARARTRVERHFSLESMVRQYESLYRTLYRRTGGAGEGSAP
jgi:glycosyltransferase involved in cell wall biosynthesis